MSKVKILIEEKDGVLHYESEGDFLEVAAALLANACNAMYNHYGGNVSIEKLKNVMKKQIEGTVDILEEQGEFKNYRQEG